MEGNKPHVETIKYEDFNGVERTEDFLFHLTEADVVMWLAQSGGYNLDQVMDKLMKSENSREILKIFEDLLYRAYGEKSLDGKRFIHASKDPDVASRFFDTPAYSVLLMHMIRDAKFAGEFLNNIIPKNLADEVAKILAENPEGIPDTVKDYIPEKKADVVPITQ